ncbi:HupE/UreJ family protein [Fibrella sp. ES10-3-2-2]
MTIRLPSLSRLSGRLRIYVLVWLITSLPSWLTAHPMPNSVVLLDIQADRVAGEVQLPLSELELAFGHALAQQPGTLIARFGPELRRYIQAHIRPTGPTGRTWTVEVGDLSVQSVAGTMPGMASYTELTAQVLLRPPVGESPRRFTLHYDVIVHQLVTHKTLVSIRQDWETGRFDQDPAQIGVVQLDVPSNTIPPLAINQAPGTVWRGFKSMVGLGIDHIAAGTDHLLFLLALLLPAPLLVSGKRWGRYGGPRYSLLQLLRIVTAFTVGHSITLLIGAAGWWQLPAQPVEILIAFSILVSAIHAWRPLFAGREVWVAAGFGLIHGLAFASTLANLTLSPGRMALSILGFNLGIELMQLVVIGLTIPWLILLSRTLAYGFIRVAGALFAGIAALAWLSERILGQENRIAGLVDRITGHAHWLLIALIIVTLISIVHGRMRQRAPLS